jgi:hypothetical protein
MIPLMRRGNGIMFQSINASTIIKERLASSFGLEKYGRILHLFKDVDISQDEGFQKLFNGFYRVRNDENWRKEYYTLFESKKNTTSSFEEIIRILYEKTGRVEASFASKMIATIDTEMPIWDQYVLRNLGLKLEGTKETRLSNAISLYRGIRQWYAEYLETENAEDCIAEFDRFLPKYAWLSPVKKIDCFLWSMR